MCGECVFIEDVIEVIIEYEFKNVKVFFIVKEWLIYWWEFFFVGGGWYVFIVLVDGKIIF